MKIMWNYSFSHLSKEKTRIRLGLDERKGSWARFSWKFSGQCYTFFLAFSPVSLTDIALILVWSLHSAQGSGQTCPWHLKLITSQVVEGTWISTGGYGRLRSEWVLIVNKLRHRKSTEIKLASLNCSKHECKNNLWENSSCCCKEALLFRKEERKTKRNETKTNLSSVLEQPIEENGHGPSNASQPTGIWRSVN